MNSPLRVAPLDDPADASNAPTSTIEAVEARVVVAPALLLTRAELAIELRTSIKSIDRLDQSGKPPRPVRIGTCRRWPRETIVRWIAAGCPSRSDFEAFDCGSRRGK